MSKFSSPKLLLPGFGFSDMKRTPRTRETEKVLILQAWGRAYTASTWKARLAAHACNHSTRVQDSGTWELSLFQGSRCRKIKEDMQSPALVSMYTSMGMHICTFTYISRKRERHTHREKERQRQTRGEKRKKQKEKRERKKRKNICFLEKMKQKSNTENWYQWASEMAYQVKKCLPQSLMTWVQSQNPHKTRPELWYWFY